MFTYKKLEELGRLPWQRYGVKVIPDLIRRVNARVSYKISGDTYWYETISWKNFKWKSFE